MPTKVQEKAIQSPKRQVIVTASAGAGKTTTMVARVINLIVERSVKLENIVMLTFTEAAAEEMKSRLAKELIEEIKKSSGDARRRLVDAIDRLPMLHCSTIDSFCYSLVKTHFEFLGLPPTVTIAEEEQASSYRKKAMDKTLNDFAARCLDGTEENEEKYYRLLNSFGKEEDSGLAGHLQQLYDYAETTEDGDAFLQKAEDAAKGDLEEHPAVKAYVAELVKKATVAKSDLDKLYFNPPQGDWRMTKQYELILSVLNAVIASRTLQGVMAAAADANKLDIIVKKERESFPDAYAVWENVKEIYDAWRNDFLSVKDGNTPYLKKSYEQLTAEAATSHQEVLTVIDLVREFKKNYQNIKTEEEVLDFTDVEHHALNLLAKDDAVAAEIGCTHLLIDESQDLNRLQEAVMRAIVRDQNLFIVGDVKQSIFRFRLADPVLFQRRVEVGKTDDNAEVLSFDENFRSSNAVIDFVNLVFGNLMTEDFGGVDYPKANRGDRTAGSGDVKCFFYPKKEGEAVSVTVDEVYSVERSAEQKEETKADAELREAEWVRDRILELVRPASGKTVLRHTKDDKEFEVSYKDIAILSQVGLKRDTLQEKVIDCLREAGIPVNVGGFVRETENTDVASLVDFLRLILSPNDDYALLSVLRSDLFSFTVDELAEIALGEGDTFAQKAMLGVESNQKLKEFFDYLQKCRSLSSSLSLYELVSFVVEDRLRLTIPMRRDGRMAMGQVLNFVETLKSGKATSSIPEYLDFFDNYYKMDLEGEIAERDAVTVMTMHKSKGLQFPIVFVIGLGRTIINITEYQSVVRMDNDFGVCKKTVGQSKDFVFSLFQQKKCKELKEDFLRLLYVAFTRAENYLYVSGSVAKKEDLDKIPEKTSAATGSLLVLAGLDGNKTYTQDYLSAPVLASLSEVAAAKVSEQSEVDREAALLSAALAYRYPHEEATKTGIKFTVTAINAMKEEGRLPATKFFPEEEVVKGTAYHAVMENIPFTLQSEAEAAAFLSKLTEDGLITPEEAADISVKRLFAGLQKVSELVGDRKVYREKSFLLHLPAREAGVAAVEDEVEVQGKLDLLAMGEEDAIIIDYKLSAHTREELQAAYRAQLDLYALAVQKSFGVSRIRKYIFVLGRNEVIEL